MVGVVWKTNKKNKHKMLTLSNNLSEYTHLEQVQTSQMAL